MSYWVSLQLVYAAVKVARTELREDIPEPVDDEHGCKE